LAGRRPGATGVAVWSSQRAALAGDVERFGKSLYTDGDPWPTSWRLLATRKPLLSFLLSGLFLLR
jgi:hypothetical protein